MRSAEIRRVYEEGRSARAERVVLFVAPGLGGSAFVARRRLGGAVERNRARRVLRAAWRAVSPQVRSDIDVVWVAREAIRGAGTEDLVTEMTELIRRLRLS